MFGTTTQLLRTYRTYQTHTSSILTDRSICWLLPLVVFINLYIYQYISFQMRSISGSIPLLILIKYIYVSIHTCIYVNKKNNKLICNLDKYTCISKIGPDSMYRIARVVIFLLHFFIRFIYFEWIYTNF